MNGHTLTIYRILDANFNRAAEALRTIEDGLRFGQQDVFLSRRVKQVRHQLLAAPGRLLLPEVISARDARGDVGRNTEASTEYQRGSLEDVLTANFKRGQQALRSLEEHSKLLDSEAARCFEQLRYELYTVEQANWRATQSCRDLQSLRLCALCDGGKDGVAFQQHIRQLLDAGVRMVQLRDKRLEDRKLLDRARCLGAIAEATGAAWVINDRPDIAALAGATGVHLGQQDLAIADARRIVGPEKWVGASVHDLPQAHQAVLDGATYLGVGPTFPSQTKSFDRFGGVELLRAVTAEIRLPAFAIGGIDLDNLAQVMETGSSRVAVCGALRPGPNTANDARRFLARLDHQDAGAPTS